MQNAANNKALDYTEMLDHYNGYIIEWAVSPSTAEPGRWMGHFRARKDRAETISGSIANLQDTAADAESKAVEIAKRRIDEVVAANG